MDKAGLPLDERFQHTVLGVEDSGGGTLLLGSMGRYRGPRRTRWGVEVQQCCDR